MSSDVTRALEAVVLVADEPVDPQLLAQLLEVSVVRVHEVCAELAAEYEREGRGFVLVRVAGGYRYQSHPDEAAYVERFALEGQSARLSAAALETLAIVAYKQPVSRAQVAAIRGVNVDGVMRTLQQRGYVDEVARDAGPGQAIMYGTTRAFLEKLGLDSLDDLPPLASFIPGAEVVEALEVGLRADPIPLDLDTDTDADADAEGAADAGAVDDAVDDEPPPHEAHEAAPHEAAPHEVDEPTGVVADDADPLAGLLAEVDEADSRDAASDDTDPR